MASQNVGMEQLLGQRDWLRRLAWHLAGQESDGEDLAQEAWLAAHRSPPDPARSPRPWLAQVLRNLIHSRRRDERRRVEREREFHARGPDRAAAVDDVYDRLELQRFLVERVMALEEALRTVVILRYFEGLDSAHISRLIGTPAGTVRWRLKRAIEQLRRKLDERHGGNRVAWVLVLAPGAPHREGGAWTMTSSRTKTWMVSLTAGGLLALASGVLWIGQRTKADRGTASRVLPGATRADPAGVPGSGGPSTLPPPKLLLDPGAVGSEQTAAGCAAALGQARDEADALEREARGLIPAIAFEAGAPNNRLRAEVLPQIERLWPAGAASRAITYQVQCRSWACGIEVVMPSEKSPEVEPRLQALATWVPVIDQLRHLKMSPPSPLGVATQWVGSRPTRDAITGKKLEAYAFFFGAPPAAPVAEDSASTPVAAPASLDACRRELATTRERMRPRLAQLPWFRPASSQFGAAAAAPTLTARVRAAAERAGARAQVECRGATCRLRFEAPPDPAVLARLRADADLDGDIRREQQSGGDLYLGIVQDAAPVLARLRAPLRQPGFFAGCPEPAREGNVLLRVLIPESGIPNEQGVFGHPSTQVAGGTLAGTAAASCLTERMSALLDRQELPPAVGGLLRFESWTWRPGEPPRMVTPPAL